MSYELFYPPSFLASKPYSILAFKPLAFQLPSLLAYVLPSLLAFQLPSLSIKNKKEVQGLQQTPNLFSAKGGVL